MRLDRGASFLLVVDVQEKLVPHVEGHERLIARAGALVRAAKLLGVPVLASEHCPDRIGQTVPTLRSLVGEDGVVSKVHFSCADEASCLARFNALGRRQVVIAGIEAHVCVMQTALGLRERGYEPFLVEDAVGSQRAEDRAAGLRRMAAAGCSSATAEMAIFEWLHRADDARFREALQIVKGL